MSPACSICFAIAVPKVMECGCPEHIFEIWDKKRLFLFCAVPLGRRENDRMRVSGWGKVWNGVVRSVENVPTVWVKSECSHDRMSSLHS